MFAILADVRNGRGFAGEGFNVISAPKGLPDDCSSEVRAISDEYGEDGHSHSFLSLAEILAFDWQQTARHQGWVTPEEYLVFKKTGKPSSWCGGVSGRNVEHLTNEQMEFHLQRLRGGTLSQKEQAVGYSAYTLVSWEEPYYESCRGFICRAVLSMARLGSPENVRMVFFFDN